MRLAPVGFTEWFNKLISGMGVREVARKIGISHPVVIDLQSGACPSEGTCVKIATAFNLPTDFVLAKAGHRKDYQSDNLVEVIYHLTKQLPTTLDKEDVAEYVRHRLRIAEERTKYGLAETTKRP